MRCDTTIESSLKSWLDHVIVPALVREFTKTKKVNVNSLLPSDNNELMTNCAESPEAKP